MRSSRRLSWIVLPILLACAAAFSEAPAVLESGGAALALDPATGGIVSLRDMATGREFVQGAHPDGLWTLTLDDGGALRASGAETVAVEPSADGGLRLAWSGFSVKDGALDARVEAEVVPADGAFRLTFAVTGLPFNRIRQVVFPRVAGLRPGEGDALAVPEWMGSLARNPGRLLNPGDPPQPARRAWEYPGLLSMQFVAFCNDTGPGVMLSSADTGAHRKLFAVCGDGAGGVGLEMAHLPGKGGGSRFAPEYAADIAVFRGGWFGAAERYRAGAAAGFWADQSRKRLGRVPAWAADTALWVWNRGKSPGVLPPATALAEKTGLPVSVFWHWWHGCAYDTGFPEYFPPREGGDAFRAALAAAEAKGVHAILYMNQRLWGLETESWKTERAERFAVKNPDGAIGREVYNIFNNAACTPMCMGTAFWRNTYAGLAEKAVAEFGAGGIYMDQACASCACYDVSHGHPRGGGSWWVEGFAALEKDIRARCARRTEATLAGEGCGEAWLPRLDLMLSLQVSRERYAAPGEWEPVPLFQAVYNDAALLFGNYASLTEPPYDELWPPEFAPAEPLVLLDRKFSAQFRLEQARALLWGQQPCLANFKPELLEQRAEETDFFVRAARLRRAALAYLRDGVMLRPPETGVPASEIPVSRLSIYAGRRDRVREYSMPAPGVLASAWRAADGGVAVVLANITEAPQTVALNLDTPDYPLPEGAAPRLFRADGVPAPVAAEGPGRVTVTLTAGDLAVCEWPAPEEKTP
ncbi:MAG: hypothetical protein GXY15_08060 [Candidatus Hydrogenedentes bacterium]|nr:hypothetical protein [Candidatus Hydrogenedentota bacterium]